MPIGAPRIEDCCVTCVGGGDPASCPPYVQASSGRSMPTFVLPFFSEIRTTYFLPTSQSVFGTPPAAFSISCVIPAASKNLCKKGFAESIKQYR